MRVVIGAGLVLAMMLGGCGSKKEARARADAQAANFIPPAVTSRLDFGSAQERRFRRLDRNGDDMISPNELPRRNAPKITSLDRNGDGKISAIEFNDGMLARFDKMDLNHDGTVTSEEQQASQALEAGRK